ncbi:MAG: hypothetical protein KF861_18780 [Planctomycetaceae bacterium]|nr:hypothetical protein [Planctomycetaceae bacterium]
MRPFTFMAVLLLAAAPATAQVQLRLKFTPGEVIRQTMTQEMSTTATVQGQKIETVVNQKMQLEQAIDSVESDGSARVRQKIARIEMAVRAPFNQGFTFDSTEESTTGVPPTLATMLKQMANAEFKARILPTGKLTDIVVPEGLQDALKSIPGASFGAGGDDSVQQLLSQSSTVFPEKAVVPGDTWSDDLSTKIQFGEMKIHRTNTYEGVNDKGQHVIDVKLELELIPAENQPIKMAFKGSESKGTILFDNTLGRLIRSDLSQNMTMEVTAGGQTIETQVLQKVSIAQNPETGE